MMSLDNLHPDIIESEAKIGRKTVGVINPSPGLWEDGPLYDDLITIVYECNLSTCSRAGAANHTHHALYGPKMLHFSDDCINCGKSKYNYCVCYEPRNIEQVDKNHYTLYAD